MWPVIIWVYVVGDGDIDSDDGDEDTFEEEEEEEQEEEEEEVNRSLEGKLATRQSRKEANEHALKVSLESGLYPEYLGCEGPYHPVDPEENSALDFLKLMWPDYLVDIIVLETNRYAKSKVTGWHDVSRDEIWTFLGIQILMAIHRLPRLSDYWSKSPYLGLPVLRKHMSRKRFWELWCNLHVVNNSEVSPGDGVGRKIKPVLSVLGDTFIANYSPSQELCVDESMVKYKGRVTGKVYMPKKPIKLGFKIWCCSCSCCGYLCTFRMYDGKPVDVHTGKKFSEKGLVVKVVKDLVSPFEDMNHVLYMDNFFTSGPLVEDLSKNKIYVVGTIKRRAMGYPQGLKECTPPPKGTYLTEKVGDICYYLFSDRGLVSFVSNVFPPHMKDKVARIQRGGVLRYQSVPPVLPAYNKYMGGVDRLNQVRRSYGFDRKSRRYWLRLFFQFFDYATDNAHILYKHNCVRCNIKPVELLRFRLNLVDLLLRHSSRSSKNPVGSNPNDSGCCLKRVSEIGISRGRCHHCVRVKRSPLHYTSYGCSLHRVRLCKTPCFSEFHRQDYEQ